MRSGSAAPEVRWLDGSVDGEPMLLVQSPPKGWEFAERIEKQSNDLMLFQLDFLLLFYLVFLGCYIETQ